MAQDSESMAAPQNAKDSSDVWYHSTMSFLQKWRVQAVRIRSGGVIARGIETNRWTPWAFQFICLGSMAWMTLVAEPHHYRHDLLWLIITEVFTFYVFTQVIINWLFICFTTSTYVPENTSSESSNPNDETPKSDDGVESGEGSTERGSRIMIATGIAGKKVQRRSVPYWSWVQCFVCQRKRPPRCHHCTLCKQCVLKRDHHCYFTRNCIGLYNQRYFIYFLFWCIVFTNTGCYQLLPFIFKEALSQHSYIDLIVPINFVRSIFGQFPLIYCHLVIIMWGGLFLTFFSIIMFGDAAFLMLRGVTKFERDSGIKVTDTRPILERVRSVMGQNWAVGLFIPGGMSFSFVTSRLPTALLPSQPVEDAIGWPFIKL